MQNPPIQTELDDDTKYLMEFHQQIIPSQNLVKFHSIDHVKSLFFQLDTIEDFVNAVENALKSSSDQLCSISR